MCDSAATRAPSIPPSNCCAQGTGRTGRDSLEDYERGRQHGWRIYSIYRLSSERLLFKDTNNDLAAKSGDILKWHLDLHQLKCLPYLIYCIASLPSETMSALAAPSRLPCRAPSLPRPLVPPNSALLHARQLHLAPKSFASSQVELSHLRNHLPIPRYLCRSCNRPSTSRRPFSISAIPTEIADAANTLQSTFQSPINVVSEGILNTPLPSYGLTIILLAFAVRTLGTLPLSIMQRRQTERRLTLVIPQTEQYNAQIAPKVAIQFRKQGEGYQEYKAEISRLVSISTS